MTDQKTLAIFGAGTGLGASAAKKFGSEGFKIALVARNATTLADLVAELAADGIEAMAFPADLADTQGLPHLARTIEDHFGGIDVAVYAPVPDGVGFVPAAELDASTMERISRLYTLGPIEIFHAILPKMLSRGSGGLIVVDGTSAIHTMPGLSGVGPAFAATRNWILTLHEEVKHQGVYAGTIHIGAMIERSTGLRMATSGGRSLPPGYPMIDPDDIAQEILKLVTERDRVESSLPAMPKPA